MVQGILASTQGVMPAFSISHQQNRWDIDSKDRVR
jgi:hypothetical protein